jgi:hypothetical protein
LLVVFLERPLERPLARPLEKAVGKAIRKEKKVAQHDRPRHFYNTED